MMFAYNHDQATRDAMLGICPNADYLGGVETIKGVKLDVVEQLIDQRFADPDEAQNNSPTISGFVDFMREHPRAVLNGYAVESRRFDYRVSFDCILLPDPSEAEVAEFARCFAGSSDDFGVGEDDVWAWWD